MTRVALGSVKASPGVTTTAVAFAATWPPGRQVTVVEADPAGGDLAARYGLPGEPSLLTLAAAARRDPAPDVAVRHCQHLPGGLAVLLAPASADQAQVALGMLSPADGLLGGIDGDVLVDAGRLDPRSAALALAGSCELLVICVRPVLAELHHLAARVETLRSVSARLGVVLVGDGDYPPAEIADALAVEVLGVLPADSHGAGLLAGQAASLRTLGRLALLRSARSLAETICTRLAPVSPPGAAEPRTGPGEDDLAEEDVTDVGGAAPVPIRAGVR